MSIIVQHNMIAMNANRQLGITNKKCKNSAERLSSGYRINRAADDASGLKISEKMRGQIRGLHRASNNITDGISYVQVADGALNEVTDMLQRMRELAVQGANGTNTDVDRDSINGEVQQLKAEMERIFVTTEFNTLKIWDGQGAQTGNVLRVDKVQTVTVNNPYCQIKGINDTNYDVVACGGYRLHAEADGLSVSWTGYNGKNYATNKIAWDDMEQNGWKVELRDILEADPSGTLYDADLWEYGGPVLNFSIGLSVISDVIEKDDTDHLKPETIAHIVNAIDGKSMSSSCSTRIDANFENADGSAKTYSGVSIYLATIQYAAAYASQHNATTSGYIFTNQGEPDSAIEADKGANTGTRGNMANCPLTPYLDASGKIDASTLTTASTDTGRWSFDFTMAGIGKVQATSSNLRYYSHDQTSDDEKLWWTTYKGSNTKYQIDYSAAPTVGGVMSCLTGDASDATPGLLNKREGGYSDTGGTIILDFDLTSSTPYTYGNGLQSNSIGKIELKINVTNTDTEESVLQRIADALNEDTILDIYSEGRDGKATDYIYSAGYNADTIDRTVYEMDYDDMELYIQAGANEGESIHIVYENLRLDKLKMYDTNTKTEQDCQKAISEIDSALAVITEQRAVFGAYQNRMEHAGANADNMEENLQAAESIIRDTDMAKEMVEYSKHAILAQAGEAMLAQANQSNAKVVDLLS